jgi:hypothetical protein
MGPPGTEPLFPLYDIIDPGRDDVELRGMRLWGEYAVGMVRTATGCSTGRTSSIRGIS